MRKRKQDSPLQRTNKSTSQCCRSDLTSVACTLVFVQEISSRELTKSSGFYLLEQLLHHGIRHSCECHSLSLKCPEFKKSQWMNTSKALLLSFLPALSSWPQYSCSPQLSTLAATCSLFSEHHFHKILYGVQGFWGFTYILAHFHVNPFANQNWLHNSSQPSQQKRK